MPYWVAIRAYGAGDTSDSNIVESGSPVVGTPYDVIAVLVGDDVQVDWEYEYQSGDSVTGFYVYIGYNPMPQPSEFIDNGMDGGDAGYPQEQFTFQTPNTWFGQVYVCVIAYGDLDESYSTVVPLMLPPRATLGVQVDGVSDISLRWASDLHASTRASQEPSLELRGLPIGAIVERGQATILDTQDSVVVTYAGIRATDFVVANYANGSNGGGALWIESVDANVGFTVGSTASVSSDTPVNWCVIRAMERTV